MSISKPWQMGLVTRHWRALLAVAIVAGGLVSTLPLTAAACSGVSYPRVRYWCDTISPNIAKITGLSYKKYNEIYEGHGASLAIYFRNSAGTMLYATYGTNYVYKTISPGTLKAACWNRSSYTITARCDYVDA